MQNVKYLAKKIYFGIYALKFNKKVVVTWSSFIRKHLNILLLSKKLIDFLRNFPNHFKPEYFVIRVVKSKNIFHLKDHFYDLLRF